MFRFCDDFHRFAVLVCGKILANQRRVGPVSRIGQFCTYTDLVARESSILLWEEKVQLGICGDVSNSVDEQG